MATPADQPTAAPLDDVVARQYQRYRYPEPIRDLDAWSRDNWQWFDPRHAARMLWPDHAAKTDLDILIAGCGTNQAAVFAYSNPQAQVLAVDVSEPSLAHERWLKAKYSLDNLELLQRPIEDLPRLGQQFDLIVSTGVLHHLASPETGLRALAQCLRPDGVMGLMLYAKYGRVGVEWLQSVCRELGLGRNDASVAAVRAILAALPAGHPVRSYLQLENNLAADAVLVDTFLHGRERSYSVDDCVAFVASAGLVFQGWFFNAPYHPHGELEAVLRARGPLTGRRVWSLMERLYSTNACHFFMARRNECPSAAYAIDFEAPACFDYIPEFRMRCGLAGDILHRPDWHMTVTSEQLPYAQRIDGRASIRAIADAVAAETAAAPAACRATARDVLRAFWQLDFIAIAINTAR